MNTKNKKTNYVLSAVIMILLGAATVIIGVLYVNVTEIEFIAAHKTLIETLFAIIVSLITIIAYIFQLADKNFIYKIVVLVLIFAAISLAVLYVLKISGFWDKIDSIEDFRAYVSGYGAFTIPIFILIQFLQVVILPIPGFITIGAGVALFGPFWGTVYSTIGILSASIVAFFIGRKLGYKVARWLVGKEALDKWVEIVKGKDKVILTFMFLFPFFPDDILCFVAGLSSMSTPYYLVMITVTRIVNIAVSSYSINGNLIPYNTWWGLLIWGILFAFTAFLCYLIYKYGDKIENGVKRLFSKKKVKNGQDDTSHRSE